MGYSSFGKYTKDPHKHYMIVDAKDVERYHYEKGYEPVKDGARKVKEGPNVLMAIEKEKHQERKKKIQAQHDKLEASLTKKHNPGGNPDLLAQVNRH